MSEFSIHILDVSEVAIWDDFIDRSENGTIFHKYNWLKAAEGESRTTLFPLVCKKEGEGIVSVFPVFLQKKGFLRILMSPPNGCAIPEMGPVFLINAKKQYKRESDQYNIISACTCFIKRQLKPHFQHILTNLYDVRPFTWLEYNASPYYTYKLDLFKNIENIYHEFDANVRNRIKKFEKKQSYFIKNGSSAQLKSLLTSLSNRYSEKNRVFKLKESYVSTLAQSFGIENLDFSIVYLSNKPISSFITLKYKDQVSFWLGGIKDRNIPDGTNEFIHWHNIQQAQKNGFRCYERIGANTKSLCENKSKYGFKPHVYFKLQKSTMMGKFFFKIFTLFLRKNK